MKVRIYAEIIDSFNEEIEVADDITLKQLRAIAETKVINWSEAGFGTPSFSVDRVDGNNIQTTLINEA